MTRALAAFQRTLISGRSPYDRATRSGEAGVMSPEAWRGEALFFSEDLECFHCHGSFGFTDSAIHAGTTFVEIAFHNTGLYNIDGEGAYPPEDTGLRSVTERDADMGRFRAPTLRNIAVTAPYMHDGSIETLAEVIAHYAAGGRHLEAGPYAGDGSQSPLRSEFVNGFTITPAEQADLIAFLESLTDEAFLADPRFANPWPVP
ncbi:MAG: c-type cytochrome [bacterium]